jgi:NTE family protein
MDAKVDARPVQQVVLVLQGGGALGAYQAGVFQGLHEGGVEPDWIVGTSIGAINAALIAGNEPPVRPARLREFWHRVGQEGLFAPPWSLPLLASGLANVNTFLGGIRGFFEVNPFAAFGLDVAVGTARAAFYTTTPLRTTLSELVNLACINARHPRLTVGAVNVRTGQMRYFDSRVMPLDLDHVMASGALPPAFPAVEVDGEPYWDGGVYSNTPVEVVLDDHPRRDALIFAVNVWHPRGEAPKTIWQVLNRQKDIQYASRVNSHVARQDQIHRLRHVIDQLGMKLPAELRADPAVKEMIAYGCKTRMHLVSLLAPRLRHEDYLKDIDFNRDRIELRWEAGYLDAQRALREKPWEGDVDPLAGVFQHEIGAA